MDGVTELDAVGAGAREGAALDPRVRSHIGRRIKALYDEVAEEPVPDRFVALLEELAKKERETR